jgi:hypothetical protein
MNNLFKKAERKQAKLKIALTGPSGSGKTMSSLKLAHGIGKKIALIDTENHSASLYADHKEIDFPFDVLTIDAPYTITKYIQGIEAAESAGYDVLIIDSLSHAWAADGGLLSKKEALDSRGGNSFSNWAGITKEHEALKAKLLNCKIHLICTMRSKQDYVLEVNDKGKSAPRKVGLAPIQREGMEYEFTTVFDVGMDHSAATSKDRTGLFNGFLEKLNTKHGKDLLNWLNSAQPEQEPEPTKKAPELSAARAQSMSLSEPEFNDHGRKDVFTREKVNPLCRLCGEVMILNKAQTHYYCPNFENKTKGQHNTIMVKALEAYLKSQAEGKGQAG